MKLSRLHTSIEEGMWGDIGRKLAAPAIVAGALAAPSMVKNRAPQPPQQQQFKQDQWRVTGVKSTAFIQELKNQLKQDEGIRNIIYRDSNGILTVGVGFNLERRDADEILKSVGSSLQSVHKVGLTTGQIDRLLDICIDEAISNSERIFPNFNSLNNNLKLVIANMMFNLGPNKFLEFKDMIKAIKEGNLGNVVKEMTNSKWYSQVGDRAKRLIGKLK